MLFAALKPNIQSKKVTSVNCQHHLKQPIHPHEEVLQQPNDIGARAVQYGQNSNIAKNNNNNFMNIAIAIFFFVSDFGNCFAFSNMLHSKCIQCTRSP